MCDNQIKSTAFTIKNIHCVPVRTLFHHYLLILLFNFKPSYIVMLLTARLKSPLMCLFTVLEKQQENQIEDQRGLDRYGCLIQPFELVCC